MNTNEHQALIKSSGLKVTAERLSVLNVLEKATKPLSVKEIKAKLSKAHIDQTTIYRTMDMFVNKKIARLVNLQHDHNHYELNTKQHHHHLICESCGKVVDVSKCDTKAMEQQVKKLGNFATISSHALEFFGTCRKCAKSKN